MTPQRDGWPLRLADRERVQRTLALMALGFGVGALVQAWLWWMSGAAPQLYLALVFAPTSALFWVACWLSRRGEVRRGVLLAAMGAMVLTVPGTLAAETDAVLPLGPLVIAAFAMPYLDPRGLMLLGITGTLATLVNMSIAWFVPRPALSGELIPVRAQELFYAVVFVGLIFALLWSFARRMAEVRADEEGATRRASEASSRLAAVLSSSPTAITVFDPDGVTRVWNKAAEDIFEVPANAAIGSRIEELVNGDARALDVMRRASSGEVVSAEEIHARTSGGAPRTLEVSAAPLRDGETLVGVVALAHDITERKSLEAANHQAQKLESLALLAGGIAHDFNNLLTIIVGETSLMATKVVDAPQQRSLQNVDDAAQRAAELCRQLLSMSRKQLIQPRPYDVGAVVAGVLPMLQRAVGDSISLRFEPPERAAVISIDKAQLEQVVMNLVLNARDAMPAGGAVEISVEARDDAVTLAVRDEGEGIAPEDQSRVFEPFFSTKGSAGTGLGLPTVASIVSRAHGELSLTSAPGQGSTFRIEFARASATPLPPAASDKPPASGGRVVVVDDDARIRAILKRLLVAGGWQPLIAEDGEAALSLIRAHEDVALLITDVNMPGMGGRELVEELARFRPSLRVLIVSGYSADRELAALVSSGRVAFLPKPFTREQLNTAILRSLARPAPSLAELAAPQ